MIEVKKAINEAKNSNVIIISLSNYLKKNSKNDLYIVLINIISFILFFMTFAIDPRILFPISYFLYPMDLLGFIFCLVSSMIFSIELFLIIINKVQKIHLSYIFLYHIYIYLRFHGESHGSSKIDIATSNHFVFILITLYSLTIIFIIYFIYIFYNNTDFLSQGYSTIISSSTITNFYTNSINDGPNLKLNNNNYIILAPKYKNKYIIFSFALIYFFIGMNYILYKKKNNVFSCQDWDIGLNGTRIINDIDEYPCQLLKPQNKCYMDKMYLYFDLTKMLNKKNPNVTEQYKKLIKYLSKNKNISQNTTKFAFPLTNKEKKYSLSENEYFEDFAKMVLEDIKDYDQISPYDKNQPEIVFDFSNKDEIGANILNKDKKIVHVNLNFNNTLSQERKKLENHNSLYRNILIIYTDATSRAHFQRSLPKVSSFIKQFMPYDNEHSMKMKSYQFMKYHSFFSNTSVNVVPMFFGNSLKNKTGTHFIEYFQKNGFVTGHEIDMCSKEHYELEHSKKLYFNDQKKYVEWDHENVAMFCDPSYFDINDMETCYRGAYSRYARYLYGHQVHEYMFEYATQFWEKYKKNKKLFLIGFNYGHEATGSVISYLDESLYEFLNSFYYKNYLKDSAIFIISDHGNQNDDVFNLMGWEQFQLEQKYGTFFLILAQNEKFIEGGYNEALIKNQQSFLTPYDIYDSIVFILYGDSELLENNMVRSFDKKGQNVFEVINNTDRICTKYDDWYDISFCACINNEEK